MVKTIGDLRRDTADAPDTMRVKVLINGSISLGIAKVVWLNGECVLVTTIRSKR